VRGGSGSGGGVLEGCSGEGPDEGWTHDRQRRWDVQAHDGDIVAMPLLARAAAEHRGALTGVRVHYINHAISDSLMVARALTAIGAELVNVLMPYHGWREDNHAPLRLAFEALGPTCTPEPQHPTRFRGHHAREPSSRRSTKLRRRAPGRG
jgi:hypothetical protein